ncbi:MAG: hypothetical protein Kow0010_21580 [Dehalococcoidia bacterium]
MAVRLSDSAREELQAALREIRIMAGLGEGTLNGLDRRHEPPLSRTLVAVPRRALKGVRAADGTAGSGAPPSYVVDMTRDHDGLFDEPGRSVCVGITSPGNGDGKTTLAIALASSLCADFDLPVALVDGDFETNSVAREYGLDGREGLSDVIAGSRRLAEVVNYLRYAPFTVITAGTVRSDPARLARSDRVAPVLSDIMRENRFVIVDLPSTLSSRNASVLAQRCDGVIVVVQAGKTSRRELEHTLELLHGANVVGVVINRAHTGIPRWVERALDLGA